MRRFARMWDNLHLELTSADPEEDICAIAALGIELVEVMKVSDLTFEFTISSNDFAKVKIICEKHGGKLKLCKRSGIYWQLNKLRNRPIFLTGLIIILLAALLLPTRVFFVHVYGNVKVPTRQILEAAQSSGISFGVSRREVRSEKVKNALLSNLPVLQWVGVNTSGCVANITVRERDETVDSKTPNRVTNIVADRDGYIISMDVTSGNPLCSPGQYVHAGQMIVSGYTDCGIYIQAGRSEAEVIGQTSRYFRAVTPSRVLIRKSSEKRKRYYSLLIGKKRINFWKGSGIMDATCGRIYQEKYAALPGGFQLPFALCVEEYVFGEVQTTVQSVDTVWDALSFFADDYLRKQMVAGVILSKEEWYSEMDGLICLDGEYICQEIIGREQIEKIGE